MLLAIQRISGFTQSSTYHSPTYNKCGDEKLCPITPSHWVRSEKNLTDTECRHGEKHDPSWLDLANQETRDNGSYRA